MLLVINRDINLHVSIRACLAAGHGATLWCGYTTFTHFTTIAVFLITHGTLQRAVSGHIRTGFI